MKQRNSGEKTEYSNWLNKIETKLKKDVQGNLVIQKNNNLEKTKSIKNSATFS